MWREEKVFVGRQIGGRDVWNRIEIQGLDDARGQGFDWLACRYFGLAISDQVIKVCYHFLVCWTL